jgi:3-mercaptopyruvate sulfurtransferase SseA
MESFLMGHIPGATYLDTTCLEEEPFWNKVADQELLRILLSLGICHDTTVVLYGRNTVAAARAAHLMLYAGVRDVRMLDGGYAAWARAGLRLETGACRARHPSATHFGAPFPGCPHYMVHTQQAKALLQSPDGVLASIRTWDEFTGQTSGYCYIKAKGDIAGARWGRAGDGDDMNSMSDFQQSDGTMRPHQEITELWAEQGIHAGQSVAFYCGTGWRASLAFYYAWLMGWEQIAVYDGGWFEWSNDPGNPVMQYAFEPQAIRFGT